MSLVVFAEFSSACLLTADRLSSIRFSTSSFFFLKGLFQFRVCTLISIRNSFRKNSNYSRPYTKKNGNKISPWSISYLLVLSVVSLDGGVGPRRQTRERELLLAYLTSLLSLKSQGMKELNSTGLMPKSALIDRAGQIKRASPIEQALEYKRASLFSSSTEQGKNFFS